MDAGVPLHLSAIKWSHPLLTHISLHHVMNPRAPWSEWFSLNQKQKEMWPWRRKGSTSSRRADASASKSDAREKLSQAKKDAHEKLVRACDDGDVVIVRELLAAGAVNINKKDKQSFVR
jgi:hypothetical protein